MSKQIFLFFILLSLFLAPACKTTSKIKKKAPTEKNADALLAHLIANQIKADWFSAKLQLDYAGDGMSIGVTSTLKMRKDSVIWMNVKKLGFELARVLITKDSVFVIDRINNQYIAERLNYVEEEYNVPANLSSLQAILLGNPVFFSRSDMKMDDRELSYHLSSSNGKMENHYWLDVTALLLKKMSVTDIPSERTVDIEFEGYERTPDNQNFSYIRKLELDSRETGNMTVGLKFSKVEINVPKSIQFEIPDRYTRVD